MVERKDVIKATKLIGPADLHTRGSDLVLLPSFFGGLTIIRTLRS